MKTKTIRLIQVVTLIGFSHSGTYKHTIKDIDDNTFSGYDAETEL
jgi:predicted DNA-binding transcriptional regulator AlpA